MCSCFCASFLVVSWSGSPRVHQRASRRRIRVVVELGCLSTPASFSLAPRRLGALAMQCLFRFLHVAQASLCGPRVGLIRSRGSPARTLSLTCFPRCPLRRSPSCTCLLLACRSPAGGTLTPEHPRFAQLLYPSRIDLLICARLPRSAPRGAPRRLLLSRVLPRPGVAKEVSCASPFPHRDDVRFPPIRVLSRGGSCSDRWRVAGRD